MKLYNTLTQMVEPFEPRDDQVGIYVCGITPYDTTHIGHAFTYASVDILIRYLHLRGLKTIYVQNITDVDDDILRKANQVGEDWRTLGNNWINHYIEDMKDLNILPPDYFPRASDVIPEMQDAIKSLLDEKIAYQINGNVYYSINAWPEFGKLCHLPKSQMLPIANERGNYPDDPCKKDPLDFVLWQSEQPGEPAWESPWGRGRPGWHIECSTMATKYIGKVVDIHGGGADLCFPHHEAEIAQVEPVSEKTPFVRYWFHTSMVEYKGKKMSKSLGNLIMVRDLLEYHSPDAIRIYLGTHHYRRAWTFDEKDLQKAERLAEKLKNAVTVLDGDGPVLNAESAWAAFVDDMDNDLNTPSALDKVEGFANEILEAAEAGRNLNEARKALREFTGVFGLRLEKQDVEKRVANGWENYRPKPQENS